MTKNNLATHLKWLLKQGPSLYPSLTPSESDNQIIRVDHQINPPLDAPTADIAETHATAGVTPLDTGRNGAEVDDDPGMATTLPARQSARKPRIHWSENNARSPVATGAWKMDESPSRDRDVLRRNPIKSMGSRSLMVIAI